MASENLLLQPVRVLVIGAGISGLSSARYLQEAGVQFTVLEATRYIGGTWRYEPRVGTDEYGLPVRTSMYKHLRTNLPKAAMEFPGFPLPADYPEFPTGNEYYEYVKTYATSFDLYKNIKFLHEVLNVSREDEHWLVKHRNVKTGELFEENFDYVLACSGHYSTPNKPIIVGEENFKGRIIHSHDYRDPEPFTNRTVLVVGAGPSGMDIGLDVAVVSRKLIHSNHSPVEFKSPFPENWVKKPDIKEFMENGVVFADGSFEVIEDVIYCTGFQYHYPFLDQSSGLTLQPRYVIPLYRYMVNIHHPSMLLLGLVVRACVVTAIDAQARYAAALISRKFSLPSQEVMMADWRKRADAIRARNRPLSDIHLLAAEEDEYYANLTAEAGIERVPPVLFEIRKLDTAAKLENLYTYRDYQYIVHNDRNFTRVYRGPGYKGKAPKGQSGLTP